MFSPSYKQKRQIFRAIAILFLFYTGADLLVPQICAEERGFASPQSIAPKLEVHRQVAYANSLQPDANDSEKNQTPEQPCQDEDCFCCCAHLVSGSVFDGTAIADVRVNSLPRDSILVSSPFPKAHFHPPRFA